ncbi:MAG: inorganic phosphate transporter, partial [Desulfuromonadales bacterium]|nr:inorganic phosphate transporter [Desulfuromonadales bacterium]
VSSSQAIVGAVVGMGLLKGGHTIRWKMVGGIAGSWITTPIFACLLSFICLFILQNVFQQTVYYP